MRLWGLLLILLLFVGCTADSEDVEINKVGIHKDCEGTDIKFDYPPVELDKIAYIVPMGRVHGEHVLPTDHQYYIAPDFMKQEAAEIVIDVYSPADGVVTDIQHMGSFRGDEDRPPMDDYRLVIQHTCTISSAFIHIDEISSKLAEVAPAFGEYTKVDVPVKAGEVIGTYRGSVDYNVVDDEVMLAGIVNPQSYKSFDEDKLHISDPFDYFNDELRSRLIAKSIRTAKPEGGKIDYDVDGRLVGSWFREGTRTGKEIDFNTRYWTDHLAVVYDHIDPEYVVVSIGSYEGKGRQFGVKGNSPDPAEVSVETGLVKYELVSYYYGDWDQKSLVRGIKVKNYESTEGVVLFQLIEDRKLKVEIFPGKTSAEVNGFTENAKTYER